MKFENTRVMNFESAFHGIRNPMNSWDKSDSFFGIINIDRSDIDLDMAEKWVNWVNKDSNELEYLEILKRYDDWLLKNGILNLATDEQQLTAEVAFIGPQDMTLAQKLIKHNSSEQRKFLRQIIVSVDITAPLYYFKELDTYKVGTTANSTSTMHTLTNNEITLNCFETNDYCPDLPLEFSTFDNEVIFQMSDEVKYLLDFLNNLRNKYLETKDKRYWKELIRWLPESWLQTRTWSANYEVLYNICKQRKNHKLIEWHMFIEWVKTLPYVDYLFFN